MNKKRNNEQRMNGSNWCGEKKKKREMNQEAEQ